MKTQRLTCIRCGHEGYDVDNWIVEVSDSKLVTYSGLPHSVPERFRRESRCINREACSDRLEAALEPAPNV